MDQFGPGGNFPVKVVHLQRWSSLTGRSSLTRNKLLFHFQNFQSRSSSSLHTIVKTVDGSDVSVYECSVCKLQMQDLNFLRYSRAPLFVFSSGFHQLLKKNILLASTIVDDVFPCFSLFSLTQQLIWSEFWFRRVPFSLG